MKYKNKQGKRGDQARLEGVAPAQILRDDFAALDAKTVLRCSYDVEQLLLMQSVEGHAHAGHGLFYGNKYPNTTIDDVARALRLDTAMVKADRQELIDEIINFVERVISGEKITTASNDEGDPLLRCGIFRQLDIEPHGVLQGLYLGGLRDDVEIRKLANLRYGVEMGYGECRLVNQRVLHQLGLDGYELSQRGHEDEIEEFERAGLFAEDDDTNVAFMYVRYKEGPGASDDAAIVMAGKMLGFSAAVGCFLADAIDTLEKYVPKYSNQDSELSAYIADNYTNLGLTKNDAVDLAYLCAIPEDMVGRLPDCSLRHFLEVDRKHDQSALESHLAYLAGRPYTRMELDHGECDNVEFYQYIEKRFAEFENIRHLSLSNGSD
jgi:hypothetical protein